MNIKVLQYIDNTPKNNITTGQAAVTGDNIPSIAAPLSIATVLILIRCLTMQKWLKLLLPLTD